MSGCSAVRRGNGRWLVNAAHAESSLSPLAVGTHLAILLLYRYMILMDSGQPVQWPASDCSSTFEKGPAWSMW